jgi:hypothetical protein
VDNLVAYRDDSHISEILARHLTPLLLHEVDLLMDAGPLAGPTLGKLAQVK